MPKALIPSNEIERLRALVDYNILDTDPEPQFDEITDLISDLCGVPIVLISLIDKDRQWFKSRHGLDATETPRDLAFCAHAILQDDFFEVEDSLKDDRFLDNALATSEPHVRFYAAVPLKTPNNQNIGTICAIDNKPNKLSGVQRKYLETLASHIIKLFELRKYTKEYKELIHNQKELISTIDAQREELLQFSYRASHDLKSPLARITKLAKMCEEYIKESQYNEAIKNLLKIKASSNSLQVVIDDIIELSKSDIQIEAESFDFSSLVSEVLEELEVLASEYSVKIDSILDISSFVTTQKIRLRQILSNLITNSIKYSDSTKKEKFVKLSVSHSSQELKIVVEDNGLGIHRDYHDKIFTLFQRFHPRISTGTGLGTSIMKKHVDALNGSIVFKSTEKIGTAFYITIPL